MAAKVHFFFIFTYKMVTFLFEIEKFISKKRCSVILGRSIYLVFISPQILEIKKLRMNL